MIFFVVFNGTIGSWLLAHFYRALRLHGRMAVKQILEAKWGLIIIRTLVSKSNVLDC